ncbi:hypothetical protein CC2G_001737 [Coprinopsis cinerea AmutBmut pab1-1]|nr:hypothetical protein CC2G_001737 [Coprinopsis cinerea AmutBmut pab1-1]
MVQNYLDVTRPAATQEATGVNGIAKWGTMTLYQPSSSSMEHSKRRLIAHLTCPNERYSQSHQASLAFSNPV